MNKTQIIREWLNFRNPNEKNAEVIATFERNQREKYYEEFLKWYKNSNLFTVEINLAEFKMKINGIAYLKDIRTHIPQKNKITRICNCCHKEFKTEIDEKGVPYSTRCRSCKESEKQYRVLTYRTLSIR